MTDASNRKTALILLDPHQLILSQLGETAPTVTSAMVTALHAARHAGLQVMYVLPHYRLGYPELGPHHGYVRETGLFQEPDKGTGLPASFARRPEEPIIAKFAYSPFFSTDLELMLRRSRITELVLAGVSTSGVVLSALRDAHDRDFNITILADACADFDPEIHQLCITKIFPAQAVISDSQAWAGSL